MRDAVVDRDCRLVTLRTSGERALHGALWDHPDPAAAVLHLHGKGGNFYSGPPRFIPRGSGQYPVRHLSLNLRSHDLGYTRDDAPYEDFETGSTPVDGGCWEDLDTGTEDVGTGRSFLRGLGDVPVFIVGHSSGGWYATRYCAQDASVAGQVLVSSVLDIRRSLRFWFPAGDDLDRACDLARRMVDDGDGDLLIPLDRWYHAISARSLLQRVAQPRETWTDAMRASGAPVLMVWGSHETRDDLWQQHLDDLPDRLMFSLRVPGARHDFIGHEDAVVDGVMEFISHVTAGAVPFSGPTALQSTSPSRRTRKGSHAEKSA